MSTPNFPRPVIGTYYAIGMNNYDRDEIKLDMEMQEDDVNDVYEVDVDERIQMLQQCDMDDAIENVKKELDEINTSVSYKVREKWYDTQWSDRYIRVSLDIKWWYYEWALLDIKIEWDDCDDMPKYAEKKLQSIIKKIEKIFKSYSTQLRLDWVFSNWEAIYSLVK